MSAHQHAHQAPPSPRMRTTDLTKAGRPTTSQQKKSHKRNKARKSHKQKDGKEEQFFNFEDEEGMTTTFLQYCTVCEKQILVANSAYLYCSEECHRMDALPSSQNLDTFASLPAPYQRRPTITDSLARSAPRYIPALKPTRPHEIDARIPPKQHNAKIDLDPTEWKPAEPFDSENDGRTKPVPSRKTGEHTSRTNHSKSHPEALLYLSKNQQPSATKAKHGMTGPGLRAMPSLSHASTATASSSSSSISDLSDEPYSFVSPSQVSVPPASVGKGSFPSIGGLSLQDQTDFRYEKRPVGSNKRSSAARGSLKKLLAGGHVDGT